MKRTLRELLAAVKGYVMSDEEREAQRQSWVRGEMEMGNDAQERQDRHDALYGPDRCACGGLYVGGICCRCEGERP